MGRVLFIKKFRILSHFLRNITSEIVTNDLNNGIRKEIEEYWVKQLEPKSGCADFYTTSVLYPASGIQAENLKLLAIRDAVVRYHHLNDYEVHLSEYWHLCRDLYRSQCESFSQLKKLVGDAKSQLEQFRRVDRGILHISPEFCQQSQYLFLKLFNAGLIYQRKTLISSGTQLENEISNNIAGICRKTKPMEVSEQWFLRTSKFIHEFFHYLNSKSSILENDINSLHKSWTGKCNGFSFNCSTDMNEKLNIWVSKVSLIQHAEFVTVKSNSLFHYLCGRISDANGKLKMKVINPVTYRELPVYVRDDLDYPFGRDTRLGMPSVFESDHKFAVEVGLQLGAANADFCIAAGNPQVELDRVGSQNGDWLITQNQMPGILVPLAHCSVCGVQPLPERELPVTLLAALQESSRNRDFSAFSEANVWTRTICPNCGGEAEREKTFIDPLFLTCASSFRNCETNSITPVDLFVCGGDKAAYQLYFTRLVACILHSSGLSSSVEPAKTLLFCNWFLKQMTSDINQEKCLKFDEIIESASVRLSNESEANEVILDGIKKEYGCDFCHLLLLFSSRHEQFQLEQSVQTEMLTWQNNLWLTVREFVTIRERPLVFVSPWIDIAKEEKELKNTRNEMTRLVTLEFCETLDLKNCINVLRKLTNKLRMYTREARKLSVEYEQSLSALIIMLVPIMPHFAAALWKAFTSAEGKLLETDDERIAWNENVMMQKWPKIDDDYEIPVVLRINSLSTLAGGTVRCKDISELTVDKALDIGKKMRDVRRFLKKNRVLNVHLNSVRNLKAELIITAENNTESRETNINENRAKNKN